MALKLAPASVPVAHKRIACVRLGRSSRAVRVSAVVATKGAGAPLVTMPDKVPSMASLKKGAPVELFHHEAYKGPLGADEVDIKVTHNGLCHTDCHMIDDDWGVSAFPFVPGHEVVGTVVAVGANVRGLAAGDRVGYAWIKDSCGACIHCVSGQENICLKGYTGLITNGGYGGWQSFMRAPAKFAYKLPDAIDSVSAGPLMCAGVTVYAPLRRLITHPGAKVTVIGIGGLGHLALQFAAAMGADVTAMSHSPDKEAEACAFGAKHFIVSGSPAEAAAAGTQELVINTVSALNDYGKQMALLRPAGTLCVVGLPVTDIKVSVLDVVFNQKQVVGSIVGGRQDMLEMLEFAASAGVKPKCELMPLSQVNEAMARIRANKPRYRIVLTTDI